VHSLALAAEPRLLEARSQAIAIQRVDPEFTARPQNARQLTDYRRRVRYRLKHAEAKRAIEGGIGERQPGRICCA
jgi:hypothetical protein